MFRKKNTRIEKKTLKPKDKNKFGRKTKSTKRPKNKKNQKIPKRPKNQKKRKNKQPKNQDIQEDLNT